MERISRLTQEQNSNQQFIEIARALNEQKALTE